MSLVVVPCLPVARPHLREAWRSLVGQGHPKEAIDDDAVSALLWKARALPVVLDVLAHLELAELRLGSVVVELLAPGDVALAKGPLSLLAWRRDDEPLVEVLILPRAVLDDGTPVSWVEAALVRMGFPFYASVRARSDELEGDDTDNMKIDVRVRRFSLGRTEL